MHRGLRMPDGMMNPLQEGRDDPGKAIGALQAFVGNVPQKATQSLRRL